MASNLPLLDTADSLENVFRAFRNQPLSLEDLDDFYVDTEEARGANPRIRMARKLRQEPNAIQHFLFVGYKGCGKSTELVHLEKDLMNDFLVLNFSVIQELDPSHLTHIELFIVMMEKLFEVAVEHDLKVSKEYIHAVQNWISSKEIEEIREKYIGTEGEVGMELDIPLLKIFFAKFKAAAKHSSSLKEVLKRNVEPRLSLLLEHCNALVREIGFELERIEKKGMLMVIEDLDKIPIDRAKDLFVNYAAQLVEVQANIIYTFPISLKNSLYFSSIRSHFTQCFELPMIEVRFRTGVENSIAIEAMTKIVEDRMRLSLFSDRKILKQMILDSGGCLRDLFRMILDAADHALDRHEFIISESHRLSAYKNLRKDYFNSLSDYFVEGRKIEVKQFFDALVKLASNPNKKAESDEVTMLLRDGLCILDYNGDGWADVHPIMKDVLIDLGKWDGLQDQG
jgi:hypothetical protein